MDEDELEAIATLTDDELVALTEGKGADAAAAALSELYYRGHPQTETIAKRLFIASDDEWLRAAAISKLLRLHRAQWWNLAADVIGTASPQVLVRIVEEMATTDDPDVFHHASLIDRARARLADLPSEELALVGLFHNRFGAR